tara:strand:+ start:3615 stop:3833 length:219 start_codon:yes stop_codon:yes gene_type:complete
MKYLKIKKTDLGLIDFNTLNIKTSLMAYFVESSEYMGFSLPDNEIFMENEIQLSEVDFNNEFGEAEPVQLLK